MSEIAGLPFWEMHFDENGNAKHFMDDVGTGVTDLFVFAHGWNNDFNDAKDLYTRYFEVMADVLIAHGGKPGISVGVAGGFGLQYCGRMTSHSASPQEWQVLGLLRRTGPWR